MRATFVLAFSFSSSAAVITQPVPTIVKLQRETRLVAKGEGHKSFYSAMLAVGGPQPQEFRVGFDLGRGTTLLPAKSCIEKACLDRKQYSKCDSSIAEDVMKIGNLVVPANIRKRSKGFLAPDHCDETLEHHSVELPGTAKGNFVRDRACVKVEGNDTRCFPLAFLAASVMTDDFIVASPYDGIVGLGPGTGSILSNEFDFIHRMTHAAPGPCQHNGAHWQWHTRPHRGKTQGMFGLFLDEKEGEIAFGGYDSKRLKSPISWTPAADIEGGRWQVTISAIRVGNATLDVCRSSRCLAALDYGTSFLGVPLSLERQLEKQISIAGPKRCGESIIPDLQLEFEGVTVTVPVQDYSPSTVKGHFNDGPCLPDLEVHGSDSSLSPGNHLFILGESILRRYYTIYDVHSKRVGFSLATQEVSGIPKKLRMKDDISEDDNEVVILLQVRVTSSQTRSCLGLVEHAGPYSL